MNLDVAENGVINDTTEIVTHEHYAPAPSPAPSNADALIRLAIDRDADMDKLERLIALRDREEAKEAKRRFDEAFSQMQAEFKAVGRSKQGYDYRYAPIEVLQRSYGPTIAAHGFSYRWREETIEGGKRCTMTVTGHGHSEETSFDVPKIEGTKQMNPVQVAGAMSTYGRRYTFIAGFGVIIDDEDDDAQELTFGDGVAYSDYVNAIEASTTVEDAHELGKEYYHKLKDSGDDKGAGVIANVTAKHKKYLQVKGAK